MIQRICNCFCLYCIRFLPILQYCKLLKFIKYLSFENILRDYCENQTNKGSNSTAEYQLQKNSVQRKARKALSPQGSCTLERYNFRGAAVFQRAPAAENVVIPAKIDIGEEERKGGHSLARHGAHLSMEDMEKRVLGTHPVLPQARTAMKFNSEAEHKNSVNEAYDKHREDISDHFQNGGLYRTWELDKKGIGVGYTNIQSRKNPLVEKVEQGEGVKIAFAPDSSSHGFRMDSAYPKYPWYTVW